MTVLRKNTADKRNIIKQKESQSRMNYIVGKMSVCDSSSGEVRTETVRFPFLSPDKELKPSAPAYGGAEKSGESVFPKAGFAVVCKAYGTDAEHDVPALLADYLTEKNIPHDGVYPIHRLDITTAGLMLCAFTKKAAAALSSRMTDGEIRKRYAALVSPDAELPERGEMRDFLYFDRRSRKAYSVSAGKRGAKEALLDYELGGEVMLGGVAARVAHVTLRTGRTHQIRAQFAARRSPLIGDGKYGSRINYSRPALFSVSLKLDDRGMEFDIDFEDASSASAARRER